MNKMTIFEQIAANFDEKELNYTKHEEDNALSFSMGGEVADLNVSIFINKHNIILINVLFGIKIPTKAHTRIIDAINSINKNALISTLYLNKEDRSIAAQAFIVTTNEKLDNEAFDMNIASCISRLNENAEKIMRISFSDDEESLSEVVLRTQIKEALNDDKLS